MKEKKMNVQDLKFSDLQNLDFVEQIEKIVITGGEDGIVCHIHHKNSNCVDAVVFANKLPDFSSKQGEITV